MFPHFASLNAGYDLNAYAFMRFAASSAALMIP
jgi:hypothetical protein